MQKRYLYTLLFALPGFFIALLAALFLFGAAAGLLWLFVLGDDPWPVTVEKGLALLPVAIFLVVWLTLLVAGYLTGKKLEATVGLDRRHLAASAVLTVVPVLVIVLHQWGVGNLGPASDGQVCNDYCRERGYATSGMPPRDSGDRSCLCYDDSGREISRVPLDSILSDR